MEVIPGLWQFQATHPEWEDGDDWPPEVAWWAASTEAGLVLVDPLVEDWAALDTLIADRGGCAAIVRTCYWHERSIETAAARYDTKVWARPATGAVPHLRLDVPVSDGDEVVGGVIVYWATRDDELCVAVPTAGALLFGDVMVRDDAGRLSMCPESWVERAGGHVKLREALAVLVGLEMENVLVGHGPLVLGDGRDAIARALAR
jgi:hypothetical protein